MKILVVDDDPAQTAALRRWLEIAGYDVEVAHTAIDAADHVAKNGFQLAIIDWSLPGSMSGLELGRAVRRRGLGTFLISGYSREYIRAQWRDPLEGFLQFFDKPVGKEELLDSVARVKRSIEDTQP